MLHFKKYWKRVNFLLFAKNKNIFVLPWGDFFFFWVKMLCIVVSVVVATLCLTCDDCWLVRGTAEMECRRNGDTKNMDGCKKNKIKLWHKIKHNVSDCITQINQELHFSLSSCTEWKSGRISNQGGTNKGKKMILKSSLDCHWILLLFIDPGEEKQMTSRQYYVLKHWLRSDRQPAAAPQMPSGGGTTAAETTTAIKKKKYWI